MNYWPHHTGTVQYIYRRVAWLLFILCSFQVKTVASLQAKFEIAGIDLRYSVVSLLGSGAILWLDGRPTVYLFSLKYRYSFISPAEDPIGRLSKQ